MDVHFSLESFDNEWLIWYILVLYWHFILYFSDDELDDEIGMYF